MPSILVYSEQDQFAFELIHKARELGGQLGLEVAAAALGPAAPQEYLQRGAARVFSSGEGLLTRFEAGLYAQALARIAGDADARTILISSTRSGKELAGRLAQKLGAGCITDVKSLEFKDGRLLCTRNAFGGATEATQSALTDRQVISLMPGLCEPVPSGEGRGEIIDVKLDLQPPRIRTVRRTDKGQESVDLEGAEVLVCVGKGLARQEDLKMIEELAEVLGGLVACTKPVATDQKWLPENRIIGLSGKKGKPRLALCLGISGQVQFVVGIRDAKVIVAVNTDPNAGIFQMTDYGLVGDLQQVVPGLIAAIKG